MISENIVRLEEQAPSYVHFVFFEIDRFDTA